MTEGGKGRPGDRPEPEIDWVDLGETSHPGPTGGTGRTGRSGRAGGTGQTESIEGGSREPWRPSRVQLAIAALVVVVVLGAALWPDGGHGPSSARKPAPTSSRTTSAAPTEPTAPSATLTSAAPVVVHTAPHLLGVTAGWELFGRGDGVVVRVEPAAGRVTLTQVPPLLSTGPVSFVVGRDRALVRPLDDVPAYVVRDGAAAVSARGPLASSTVVLPGPDPDHIWRQVGTTQPPDLALADLEGTIVGPRVAAPPNLEGPMFGDGAGQLLFFGVGGVYDVRDGTVERVTTGSLLAVGPTEWVAVECDDSYQCSTVSVTPETGVRRVLRGPISPNVPIGSVAPDGRTAAIFRQSANGQLGLQLLDLRTGAITAVRVVVTSNYQDNGVVWSPDSRLLFALNQQGRVEVVDRDSGVARPLGVQLPALAQLAIRPAL